MHKSKVENRPYELTTGREIDLVASIMPSANFLSVKIRIEPA
jgi:hypothetical protein